jgi:hypothetical protein
MHRVYAKISKNGRQWLIFHTEERRHGDRSEGLVASAAVGRRGEFR